MSKVYCSAVVDAPVEKVWEIVREFNGLPEWHPMVTKSTIGNDLIGSAVGCVRTIELTDGGHMKERLLALNDLDHSSTFTIVNSALPLAHYLSELRLHRVTADERTFVEWVGQFDVADAEEREVSHAIMTLYHAGLEALSGRFDRT